MGLGEEAWTRADVLSLIGLCVAVVGFGATIWQLVRTANAAVATKKTLLRSGKTQFLFLLPQFRQIELELDFAVSNEERHLAARSLSAYAYLASEVAALIEELNLGSDVVVADIRSAAAVASAAKNDVYASRSKRLSTITAGAQQQMVVVSDHISRLRNNQGIMNDLRSSA